MHNYTGIKYSLQQGQILDLRRVGGVNRDIYICDLEKWRPIDTANV